ncbi:MAG TPA: ATP-binding protein [Anaerolineales bacterium]|nr:ATP-binding protein [Anaerolineales bacterium]
MEKKDLIIFIVAIVTTTAFALALIIWGVPYFSNTSLPAPSNAGFGSETVPARVVGELSLDGAVRHARGVLPMAATARQAGFKRIVVPEVDAAEAALIPDLEIIPVSSLAALYNHLAGRTAIPAYAHAPEEAKPLFPPTDFGEVKGQEHVKRALEVAAAGGHNVLMMGPPGAGKTLLARALPGILPKMSFDESLDVTPRETTAGRDPHLFRGRPAPIRYSLAA